MTPGIETMIERLLDSYDLETILNALAELDRLEELYYYLDLEPESDKDASD